MGNEIIKPILRIQENGTMMLTLADYVHVDAEPGEILAETKCEISLGNTVAVIDKVTGKLESHNLKFHPWGKKKFLASILKQQEERK